MELLTELETTAISGADCVATIVLQLPTQATRAFNNLMITLAAGTVVTANDIINSIEGLQNVQGMSFEGIQVNSISYKEINF